MISMLYELQMLHAFKCKIMIIMTNSNLQIIEIFVWLILNFVNIWTWTTIGGKDSKAYKIWLEYLTESFRLEVSCIARRIRGTIVE
jgi:hypothetical protein